MADANAPSLDSDLVASSDKDSIRVKGLIEFVLTSKVPQKTRLPREPKAKMGPIGLADTLPSSSAEFTPFDDL